MKDSDFRPPDKYYYYYISSIFGLLMEISGHIAAKHCNMFTNLNVSGRKT